MALQPLGCSIVTHVLGTHWAYKASSGSSPAGGEQLLLDPGFRGEDLVSHDQGTGQHPQQDEVGPHVVQGEVGVWDRKAGRNTGIIGLQEHQRQSQGCCGGGDIQVDQVPLQYHLSFLAGKLPGPA